MSDVFGSEYSGDKKEKLAADVALEKADAKELHVLFNRQQKRCSELVQALAAITELYSGASGNPRLAANYSEDSIVAMRDVALAAIDLAKTVFTRKREVKSEDVK